MLVVSFKVEKTGHWANLISSLGVLDVRWVEEKNAFVGRVTSAAWTAIGQNYTRLGLVRGCVDVEEEIEPSLETLRMFARAASISYGNAFFGPLFEEPNDFEDSYMSEARAACCVLEGLGIDPDAFARLQVDPGSAFSRRGRYDDI